jgi:hypothetical protein
MEQPETPPLRPSRGRPRIDKFWAVDAMIHNGAGELFRTGRCRTPTGAIREFISRLWAGDHQAVLEIAPAFWPDYRDAVARFRPQAMGNSVEAIVRRVLRRLEPTHYRYREGSSLSADRSSAKACGGTDSREPRTVDEGAAAESSTDDRILNQFRYAVRIAKKSLYSKSNPSRAKWTLILLISFGAPTRLALT